jgi:hypothetical protein
MAVRWTVDTASNNLADRDDFRAGDFPLGSIGRVYPGLSDAELTEVVERATFVSSLRDALTDEEKNSLIIEEQTRREAIGADPTIRVDWHTSYIDRAGDEQDRDIRTYVRPGEDYSVIDQQVADTISAWTNEPTAGTDLEGATDVEVWDEEWWVA